MVLVVGSVEVVVRMVMTVVVVVKGDGGEWRR